MNLGRSSSGAKYASAPRLPQCRIDCPTVRFKQVLGAFRECLARGDFRRPLPTLQGVSAGLDQAVEQVLAIGAGLRAQGRMKRREGCWNSINSLITSLDRRKDRNLAPDLPNLLNLDRPKSRGMAQSGQRKRLVGAMVPASSGDRFLLNVGFARTLRTTYGDKRGGEQSQRTRDAAKDFAFCPMRDKPRDGMGGTASSSLP